MEMRHCSHGTALVLTQVHEDDDDENNKVLCYGCQEQILSGQSAYGCIECQVYIHKACAELPTQIQYSLHPQHPLKLYAKPPYEVIQCFCDVCGKKLDAFTYHCSSCQFDVDISCAQLDWTKIVMHLSHNHPLIIIQIPKDDNNREVICYGCKQQIPSGSSSYACHYCQVFIHKSCTELPTEIQYSLHPEHPLKLFSRPPYEGESCLCDVCGKEWDALTYRCASCQYDVDISCAQLDWMNTEHINHLSHDHPLIITQVQEDDNKKKVVCYGCKKQIPSATTCYGCIHCQVFIHKACVESPTEIQYYLHPQHPLTLYAKPPYKIKSCPCDVCGKEWDAFTYHCASCQFDVDILCAQSELMKPYRYRHDAHPHPLHFQPRPASFRCDACGESIEDESYQCTQCEFWVHKTCADSPKIFKVFKNHDHPLSLAYSVPDEYRKYDFNCDICRGSLGQVYWVYYCRLCRYFVHLKCLKTKLQEEDPLEADDSESKISLDVELVQLPATDISVELIKRFLCKESDLAQMKSEIESFSHRHPLVLFTEQINENVMELGEEEISCDGCTEPITAPYYGCVQCEYYLHSACAHLPVELQHPGHFHPLPLSLMSYEKVYGTFKCKLCGLHSNGFFYECEHCDVYIDLKCAALPNAIRHKTHKHPLVQVKHYSEKCHGCGEDGYNKLGYYCKSCDFYLAYECALLPASIRHRWDKKHLLQLRFPPHSDHPEDFICDLCEDDIHPKTWIYRCPECDIAFHPLCVPKIKSAFNVKFGQRIQIDSHLHPLKYLFDATVKTSCDECEADLSKFIVFECETCYHCKCLTCAKKVY